MLQDLRYALRMLARQPAFTAIAVLTLNCGLGEREPKLVRLCEPCVLSRGGLLFAVTVALAVTRMLAKFLFEIGPFDSPSFSGRVAIAAFVAVCACLAPAWRPSRVDSVVVLRSES